MTRGADLPFALKEEADRVERMRSVQRGGAAADAPPEGTFERYWLDKYGERIDSFGPYSAYVDQQSLETLLVASFLPAYVELLQKQKEEREELFSGNLRGRSVTMAELLQTATHGGVKALRSSHEIAEKAIEEARIGAELFMHSNTLIAARASILRPRTRAPNHGLRLVAAALSGWIRIKHRDTRGKRDGNTSWPDTARAMEWLGWDLSAIDGEKGRALRKMAHRYDEDLSKWQASHHT